MLPPKLKNKARDSGANPKGYEVVDDDGDKKLYGNKKRTPEQNGWRDSPPPFIGEDAMDFDD
jgi:hypothetical protein